MPTDFARRLLAYEMNSGNPARAGDSAAFRVCEKLRGPLGKLLGIDGFRSLLARAQALAGADVSWILTLDIGADGSLEDLSGRATKLDAGALTEGEVFLVGQLLGLLVIFIGPGLTLRLLHDIWPHWEISSLAEEI